MCLGQVGSVEFVDLPEPVNTPISSTSTIVGRGDIKEPTPFLFLICFLRIILNTFSFSLLKNYRFLHNWRLPINPRLEELRILEVQVSLGESLIIEANL